MFSMAAYIFNLFLSIVLLFSTLPLAFSVFVEDGESWLELELNSTETEFILDIDLQFLIIPSFREKPAQILSVFSQNESQPKLQLDARLSSDESSTEYVASYGSQNLPFKAFTNTVFYQPKLVNLKLVLSRFHLTLHFEGTSSRVRLRNPIFSMNFTTLRLGSENDAYSTCYEKISVNDVVYLSSDGRDASRTDISSLHFTNVDFDCVLLNPCLKVECPDNSNCISEEQETFCVEDDKSTTGSSFQGDGGLGSGRQPLSTQILPSLEVNEGSKANLDVADVEIPEGFVSKNVFFNVTRSGLTSLLYGTIINKNNKRLTIFNYEPARLGNIFYQHGGSENSNDKIVMQMLLRTQFNTFKPGNFVYVPVNVVPVNDEPQLSVDWNFLFRVERNSRRQLTSDILKIEDADNSPEDVKLFVMSVDQQFAQVSLVRKDKFSESFTEVSTFTYQNLIEGLIFVQHDGKSTGSGVKTVRIELQVADLKSFGNKTFLNVEIVDVRLHVINERLLTVIRDDPLILSESSISVAIYPTSDSLFVDADQGRLRYLEDLVEMTVTSSYESAIEVQVLDHLDNWVTNTSFTQAQLRTGRVRIVSRVSSEESVNGFLDIRAQYRYEQKFFRVSYIITQQSFDVNQNNYFIFASDTFSQNLTAYDLSATLLQPNPRDTVSPTAIVYTLTSVPEYCVVYLNQSVDSVSGIWESRLLGKGSKFSQSDVDNERVFLRRRLQALTSVTDQFTFTVQINELTSNNFTFLVHVTAIRNANFRFHQEPVNVEEGDQVVLTSSTLSVSCSFSENFFFYITEHPKHGRIEVVGTRMKKLVAFTYSELKRGVVSYHHDGSESRSDDVKILLSPITIPLFTSKNGNDYKLPINNISIVLNITIDLVHDNKPVVINNEVLNITYTDLLLITPALLKSEDPDIDQSDSSVTYMVKHSDPNVEFMECVASDKVIHSFTQGDIDSFKICARQKSDMPDSFSVIRATSSGENTSELTDETLITLHIRIVDPFLSAELVVNNFRIQRQGKLLLSSEIVKINASVYLDPYETVFVFTKPAYGKLMKNNSILLEEFSYFDFLNGFIFYTHSSSLAGVTEQIIFTVHAQNYQSSFTMNIEIIDDYFAPKLEYLSDLFVIEGKPATLSKWNLKFTQNIYSNQVPPIEYLLVKPPTFGAFFFKANPAGSSIFRFTQNEIDDNAVLYKTTVVGSKKDETAFNVTNSERNLGPFSLKIVILPPKLKLTSTDVQIGQGNVFRVLDFVSIEPVDFERIKLNVEVVQFPSHGQLRFQLNATWTTEVFFPLDWKEFPSVVYFHDDSDFRLDLMALKLTNATLGLATDEVTLNIHVKPMDRNPPKMLTPTEWKIVNGQSCIITPQVMQASDDESIDLDLMYLVKEVTSGSLILAEGRSRQQVRNFTQRQINNGNVVFQHQYAADPLKSGSFAEIIFSVSDGVNALLDQYLRIFPQPLELAAVQQNDLLSVHPGVTYRIPYSVLAVTTNDNCNDQYIYKYDVTQKSGVGQVQILDYSGSSSFLAQSVKDGNVAYFAPWNNYTWPKFETVDFQVSIPGKAVRPLPMSLQIKLDFNVLNSNYPSPLITNKQFTVYQREITYITRKELDAANLLYHEQSSSSFALSEITYVVSTAPKNGFVGSAGVPRTRFSQLELNSNSIYYNHTGVIRLAATDMFEFNVTVPKADGGILMFVGPSFNISVVTRDHPFAPVRLITRNPKLQVVQNHYVIVNSSVLLARDQDSSPDMIQYTVNSRSVSGFFAFVFESREPVFVFTQSDIDNKMIGFYSQSDSLQAISFDMTVRDLISQLNPNTQIAFTFLVQPVEFRLTISGSKVVNLEQGDWKTAITADVIAAYTNANPDMVSFKLLKAPEMGDVIINDIELTNFQKFGMNVVENKQLEYRMRKVENAQEVDSFRLQVSYQEKSEAVQNVDVKVQLIPLFSTSTLYIQPNSSLPITESHLNATLLSKKTGQISIFRVVQTPRNGILWDKEKRKRVSEMEYFDGDSLSQKQIEFRSNPFLEGQDDVRDEVRFKVGTSANQNRFPTSQWKTGTLSILISTTPYIPPTPRGPGGIGSLQGAQNKDLIAILIPVVLFLILFCIIGVFLMKRQQRKRNMSALQIEKSPASMATPMEYSKNGMFMPLSGSRNDSSGQQFPLLGTKTNGTSQSQSGELYSEEKFGSGTQSPHYLNAINNDYRDSHVNPSPVSDRLIGASNTTNFPTCPVPSSASRGSGGSRGNFQAVGDSRVPPSASEYHTFVEAEGRGTFERGGVEWGPGGGHGHSGYPPGYAEEINSNGGYRDSPVAMAHHPTIKAVVRVDSRGHIETRTVPVVDEYDRYSSRSSHFDQRRQPSASLANNNHLPPSVAVNSNSKTPLRQSQYWL